MKHTHYITALILSGVILAVSAAYLLHQQHSNKTAMEFQSAAKDRVHSLRQTIENSLIIGRSVVSLFNSSIEVSRQEFTTFTEFILKNTIYIRALEWAPRVTAAERTQFEAIAAQDNPSFKIIEQTPSGEFSSAKQRQVHFPIFYITPYEMNKRAWGYDMASNAERKAALDFAIENNRPSSTGRIKLVQNHTDAWSFLTYLPIYKKGSNISTTEHRRENLMGLVVVVFDIPALINASIAYLQPSGIHFSIYDETATPAERLLYQHYSRAQQKPGKFWGVEQQSKATAFTYTDSFSVNNRRWSINTVPANGYFDTSITLEIWLVFIAIITITLLLAAYLHLQRQRELDLRNEKDQLENTVSARTQALAAKNKELETFSYSIAHDLRSPLRAITGFSQILLNDAHQKLNNEEQDYLSRIISAGKHMADLIDDILALSRVNQGKLNRKEVDLSDIANAIAERVQNTNQKLNHHVEWHIQQQMKASGDPHLLTLLMDNLILNAYKFSSKVSTPVIEVGLNQNIGEKIYYVRDNGIGFDMKFEDKIFGVFQRLHNRENFDGTGIGLATVKRIIERHHGRVWAKSKTNEGATFYFTLCPQPNNNDQYV